MYLLLYICEFSKDISQSICQGPRIIQNTTNGKNMHTNLPYTGISSVYIMCICMDMREDHIMFFTFVTLFYFFFHFIVQVYNLKSNYKIKKACFVYIKLINRSLFLYNAGSLKQHAEERDEGVSNIIYGLHSRKLPKYVQGQIHIFLISQLSVGRELLKFCFGDEMICF